MRPTAGIAELRVTTSDPSYLVPKWLSVSGVVKSSLRWSIRKFSKVMFMVCSRLVARHRGSFVAGGGGTFVFLVRLAR